MQLKTGGYGPPLPLAQRTSLKSDRLVDYAAFPNQDPACATT